MRDDEFKAPETVALSEMIRELSSRVVIRKTENTMHTARYMGPHLHNCQCVECYKSSLDTLNGIYFRQQELLCCNHQEEEYCERHAHFYHMNDKCPGCAGRCNGEPNFYERLHNPLGVKSCKCGDSSQSMTINQSAFSPRASFTVIKPGSDNEDMSKV